MAAVWVLIAWAAWGGAQESLVGTPGAAWLPLTAARHEGAVTLTVAPSDAEGGRVLLVVGKPEWMALDDETAPRLRAAFADGRAVEVGEGLEVVEEGKGPHLRVVVGDEANPVDPASLSVWVDGRRVAPQTTEEVEEGLAATFDLTSLAVGGHIGTLEARDLAPAANVLRLPLRLAVNGLLRHADGQTVTIARAGREYTVGGSGRGQSFVRLGEDGPSAYLTTQVGDRFVYARDVVAIEELPDQQGLSLRTDIVGIEGQDFGQIAELAFDVGTLSEFPGILLTSHARNLGAAAEVYCFWGWLPGEGFVTPEGQQAWSMTYRDIGHVGWVFLPPVRAGSPGIGVLSALRFGESRFGTLLLYTDPQRIPTATGEGVMMRLALMQAENAQAVAEAHGALEAAGWLAGP